MKRNTATPSILFRLEIIFAIALSLALARQASANGCARPAVRPGDLLADVVTEQLLFEQCNQIAAARAGGIPFPPPVIYPAPVLPGVPVLPVGGIPVGGGNGSAACLQAQADITIPLQLGLISQQEAYQYLDSRCGFGDSTFGNVFNYGSLE